MRFNTIREAVGQKTHNANNIDPGRAVYDSVALRLVTLPEYPECLGRRRGRGGWECGPDESRPPRGAGSEAAGEAAPGFVDAVDFFTALSHGGRHSREKSPNPNIAVWLPHLITRFITVTQPSIKRFNMI
jgi:hypothetical protein